VGGALVLCLGLFSELVAQNVRDVPLPELVSESGAGDGNQGSETPSISLDGDFIAFTSNATNLVPDDGDRVTDIYLYDVEDDTLEAITKPSGVLLRRGSNTAPSVSNGGGRIAFLSEDTRLDPADTDTGVDVFFYEARTEPFSLVSVSTTGGSGDGNSLSVAISDDGSVVVFVSEAGNLATPVLEAGRRRVHIRDLRRGTTRRLDASRGVRLCDVSGDGRYVVFDASTNGLIPDDNNGSTDVFLFDRVTEQVSRISVGEGRTEASADSRKPRISSDGRWIGFESDASDLVDHDMACPPESSPGLVLRSGLTREVTDAHKAPHSRAVHQQAQAS